MKGECWHPTRCQTFGILWNWLSAQAEREHSRIDGKGEGGKKVICGIKMEIRSCSRYIPEVSHVWKLDFERAVSIDFDEFSTNSMVNKYMYIYIFSFILPFYNGNG